jgi:hypothetical protein
MLDPSSNAIPIASKTNDLKKYFDVLGRSFEIHTTEF